MRGLISYIFLGLLALTPNCLRANGIAQNEPNGRGAIVEAAIDGGRLVQALEMLSEMGKHPLDFEHAELEILYAELALAQKEDARALELFVKHLQRPEYLCRAKEGSGIALARSSDWEAAIGLLADVTIKCPERWKAWNMMGIALEHFGKYEASRYAFDEALSRSENAPTVLNNLGYSLLVRHNYSEAADAFELALLRQPENERIQNNLDIARAAMGEAPKRNAKQSQSRWVERLNNSGYAAVLTGHEKTGSALLSNAVIGSSSMASKAAANLGWKVARGTKP
jgi:tetratricopeptide (TPR) repeat protein